MSELPEKVLRFDIARVNYGRRKICRCLNPHYEIDAQNRLVVCNDCGAIIDPFDALVDLAKHYERIERWNQAALDQRREIENYKPHLLVIRELEKQYRRQKMIPMCPHCGKPFDLKEIAKGSWCSRRFLEEK